MLPRSFRYLAALDMVDGTMARLSGGATKFGATLDASCDRITDGALFAAIIWYLIYQDHAHPATIFAALVVLVTSQVISYVKARGEASGFSMIGGLIERPERLILGLVGIGLEGLGIPYILPISLWLLAVGSCYTVYQRLMQAYKQDKEAASTAKVQPASIRGMMVKKEDLSAAGYFAGWSVVKHLPLPVARWLFTKVADKVSDNGKGMEQLRRNLMRVVGPENVTRKLVRDSMRSYMCYWMEAFRLQSMQKDIGLHSQLLAGLEGKELLDASLASPRGTILALTHKAGNPGVWCLG